MKLNIARRIALSMGVMLLLFFGTAIVGYILVSKIGEDLQTVDALKTNREIKIMEMLAANASFSATVLDGLTYQRENKIRLRVARDAFQKAVSEFQVGATNSEAAGLKSELRERFSKIHDTGRAILQKAARSQRLLRRLAGEISKFRRQTEAIVKRARIKCGGEMLYQRTLRALETWFARLLVEVRDPWRAGDPSDKRTGPSKIGGAFVLALPAATRARLKSDVAKLKTRFERIERLGNQIGKLNLERGGLLKRFTARSAIMGRLLQTDLLTSETRKSRSISRVPKISTGESVTFLMLMVAFGGIIGMIACLVLIRGIILPVNALRMQVRGLEISGADQPIEVHGDDGLRQISHCFNDLVAQKNATEAALRDLTLHDPLTHLPNRDLFLKRLSEATENAMRIGRLAAVQILDLDGFKEINDTLGNNIGDALLTMVGERLKECVRATDFVARLGGDEFAIIQTNLQTINHTHFVADRVIASISAPFEVNGNAIVTGASIGIAVYPSDGDGSSQLLQNAEAALKKAKQDGRGHYQLYDSALDEELRGRRKLAREIQDALANNEFYICYQPRLNTATRRVIGAEALIRWNSPSRGLVRPDEFIPVAETSGQITQITEFVLAETCRQIAAWFADGMEHLTFSVNLSPVDFRREDLVDMLQEAIQSNSIPANCLELEITEGMVMFGVEEVNKRLNELRQLGVALAIDDFGTGYSSMSYLKLFNVDTLKIDRSFINGIPDHREDIGITMAIIRMAHSLNLRVVAEGVENEEQFEFLRRRKCDEVQGYLFAKPLSPEAFTEYVRDNLAGKDKPELKAEA